MLPPLGHLVGIKPFEEDELLLKKVGNPSPPVDFRGQGEVRDEASDGTNIKDIFHRMFCWLC
jgi:hypothetical protein